MEKMLRFSVGLWGYLAMRKVPLTLGQAGAVQIELIQQLSEARRSIERRATMVAKASTT
jgi:hypothetical protein